MRQEEENRKRRKRANLKRAILETIKLAGVLGVALVAPNTLSGLAKLGVIETKRREESIRSARNRLIRQGLLKVQKGMVALTRKGEQELRALLVRNSTFTTPRRWDQKWRVLIFDIPNYRKSLRDKLRLSLKSAGFVLMQGSVWVFPYDCEDFVALLKAELKIGRDLQYLIVESIENDTWLLDVFNLRRLP